MNDEICPRCNSDDFRVKEPYEGIETMYGKKYENPGIIFNVVCNQCGRKYSILYHDVDRDKDANTSQLSE